MNSIFASAEFATTRPRRSLDGTWSFSYDPASTGDKKGWFREGKRLPERIEVPGCSQVRRYASSRGNVRKTDVWIPEQSSTIMLKHGCLHPSWYQRRFVVPDGWRGRAVHLHVGGVKPAADFWINGRKLGSTLTSRSPVRCDLTRHIRFGAENTLTARIHWPRFRLDGMFDCLFAWSGFYRRVWIEAVPRLHVADLHALTSVSPRQATLRTTVRGRSRGPVRLDCDILDRAGAVRFRASRVFRTESPETLVSLAIPMPGAGLWNLDDPVLHRAVVRLSEGGAEADRASVRFGLREIKIRGFQVLLNGSPIFLRGGCNDHVYPHTVCPPADKAFHLDRLHKAKAYGFNYAKSACDIFTIEQIEAADELGYLVCQEMPAGTVELRALRDDPPRELSDLWKSELANIVTAYRSHPSVVLYSMTSEEAINIDNPKPFRIFCREMPAIARRLDPRALVVDVTAAFNPSTRARHGQRDTDLIEDVVEQSYTVTPFQGPLAIPPKLDRPFLLHEWNWISALPHPDLVRRYKFLPLLPLQIPEMIQLARANGQGHELRAMVDRSHRLKHVLRKHIYEQVYEDPRVAGYHGWLIHDIAYCPEGVFNEFWETPRDLPAEEFRTYNGDTVLLLDDRDRRWFSYGQTVPLGIRAAHFGRRPLGNAALRWRLLRDGRPLRQGLIRLGRIGCGARTPARPLGIPPVAGDRPAKIELRCELLDGSRPVAWNHWALWFFPPPGGTRLDGLWSTHPLPAPWDHARVPYDPQVPPAGARVFVTQRLTDGGGGFLDLLGRFMNGGGRVLLLSDGALPEAESSCYRTVPYNLGRIGNMGTLIHPHPALGDFPHEGWCDLHCAPLLQGAYPMRLDVFGAARIKPIIRSIGHHVTMEDKGYLFEARVGKGLLLACSLKLQTECHTNPAARHLLGCLLSYLRNGKPKPRASLTIEQLQAVLKQAGKKL